MKVNTLCRFGSIILIVIFLLIMGISNYSAINMGSYSGKYDYNAKHKVNVLYDPNGTDKVKAKKREQVAKTCYQHLRAYGLSVNGAAALVGNFANEGTNDPSTTEGHTDWSNFVFGTTGIGIMGFTYYTYQQKLFDMSYKRNVQWMDLGVQLDLVDDWIHYKDKSKRSANDKRYYKENGDSVEVLTEDFCTKYERPGIPHLDNRIKSAQDYAKRYKNLEPKKYEGSLSNDTASSQDSKTTKELSGKDVTTEWDLEGMPKKSGLVSKLKIPKLATREGLSINEKVNLVEIGNDTAQTKEFNVWTKARAGLVFFGLLMMVYTLFLAMAMLFDKMNSFIDLSMVSVLTFGLIHYSDDAQDFDTSDSDIKYTSSKRMIVLILVLGIIAGLFISGGVLPSVMRTIYSIISSINNK